MPRPKADRKIERINIPVSAPFKRLASKVAKEKAKRSSSDLPLTTYARTAVERCVAQDASELGLIDSRVPAK